MTDTSPTVDLLGPEDLRPLVLDIIERMPDNVNPMDGSSCLYTDPEDPTRHCLIGQLAAEQGWDFDESNGGAESTATVLGWPVTAEGARFLGEVQGGADGFDFLTRTANPIPWRLVEVPAA